MKMYFTPIKSSSTTSANSAPTTQFDSYMSDIGAAKAVSNQQTQKAEEQTKLLDSLQ